MNIIFNNEFDNYNINEFNRQRNIDKSNVKAFKCLLQNFENQIISLNGKYITINKKF